MGDFHLEIKSDRLCTGNETNVVDDTQVDHRILITRSYMNYLCVCVCVSVCLSVCLSVCHEPNGLHND